MDARGRLGRPSICGRLACPQRALPPIAAASGPVVPDPDYKLAASLLLFGSGVLFAPWLFGGFLTLLGVLIFVQTLRIRFVFDDDAFEVGCILRKREWRRPEPSCFMAGTSNIARGLFQFVSCPRQDCSELCCGRREPERLHQL